MSAMVPFAPGDDRIGTIGINMYDRALVNDPTCMVLSFAVTRSECWYPADTPKQRLRGPTREDVRSCWDKFWS